VGAVTLRRLITLAVLVAGPALATASSADAATYCVSDPSCVTVGGTLKTTLTAALSTAQGTTAVADTIKLGAGTFTGPFTYDGDVGSNRSTNGVTIEGAGEGQTILTGTAHADVLDFDLPSSNPYEVRDLTVSLPSAFDAVGLRWANAGSNISVVDPSGDANGAIGIELGYQGTFSQLNVDMPRSNSTRGIYQSDFAGTLTDSTVSADWPMLGDSEGGDYSRLNVHGGTQGFNLKFRGPTNTVDDVQIVVDGNADFGAFQAGNDNESGTVDASHLTVTGPSPTFSVGVEVANINATYTETLNLRDSVVTGFEHQLARYSNGPEADMTVTNSVLRYGDVAVVDGPGTGTVTANPAHGDVNGNAHLVDSGGILHPRFDSAAIDLGTVATPATDLLGAPRNVDGDGDGHAHPDAGAVEYQHKAPVVTAAATGPFVAGSPTAFTGTATDPDPGDVVTPAWAFSDATTALELSPSHTFAAAGPFTATLTATDSTGLTATAATSGTIANPPVVTPPPPPPIPKPIVRDTIAPRLHSVAFSPRTFRVSRTDTAVAARAKTKAKPKPKPPIGSRLAATLSEKASLKIVIAERHSGRTTKTKSGTCKATTHATRHHKACFYYTTNATLTRKNLASGARHIAFSGRIRHHALPVGLYRATVTATDPAGNRSSAATATFAIAG
jgi:hypothetical protein